MTKELEEFNILPSSKMDDVTKLWSICLGPSKKMQALRVVIDPRIWFLEHQGFIALDNKLFERA